MTLSALNAPEGDVDIEGLGDSGTSKKLDFDSGRFFNPSNDEATFVQRTRKEKIFENHLNPVMLIFIG